MAQACTDLHISQIEVSDVAHRSTIACLSIARNPVFGVQFSTTLAEYALSFFLYGLHLCGS
jgi:hypothetical protein